jgi:hypothetical protein
MIFPWPLLRFKTKSSNIFYLFSGATMLLIKKLNYMLHFDEWSLGHVLCLYIVLSSQIYKIIFNQSYSDLVFVWWKSISRVNDILVFVVNTRVINRLFKCEGLLVNDLEFINPSKVKRSKHRRPRFSVVYFRSPFYQEGSLYEKLGWNQITHSLTPLCNMVERTLQKFCCWGFSRRRLQASVPKTPACKGRRLWLWAGDSGQRIRPPKLGFSPECANLCCPSGVFERTLRRLQGLCAREPETPGDTGDSESQSPETPRLVDPNG